MRIMFHCFDSMFGNAATCAVWHTQRGFRTIGYHYVILNGWLDVKVYNYLFDGWIETGRPLDDDDDMDIWEVGAHVKGWNKDSIGIGLVGKSGKFTNYQIKSAKILVEILRKQFGEISIFQHGDFDDKKSWCAGLTKEQLEIIKDESMGGNDI